MNFTETSIRGAFLIKLEPHEDQRGFFARMFCKDEFEHNGLDTKIVQINTAMSYRTGTIRGMHFQSGEYRDNKFVRCLHGKIYDVCVDLRRDSPTLCQSVAVELSAKNRQMLFLPEGCAHGYQTLTDNTEIIYTTNRHYSPAHATGVRYDDPAFDINWPLPVTEISDADRDWPNFIR